MIDNVIYLSLFKANIQGEHMFIDEFIAYCKSINFTKNTIKTYKYRLERFNALSINIYGLDIHSIDMFQFQNIVNTAKKIYGPRTINTTLSVLKQYSTFLKFAKNIDVLINFDVFFQKTEEVKKTYISQDDLVYLLDNCVNSNIIQLCILILYTSGIRTAELLNLRYKDITIVQGLLKLDLLDTKTRKTRTVYCINFKDFSMAEHFNEFYNMQIFQSATIKPFQGVLMQLRRAVYNYNYLNNTNVVLHDFRRSFATNMYKKKISIEKIKEMLGHSNINTTLSYIIKSETDLKEIAEEITF